MPGGTNPSEFVNAQTGTTYTFADSDGGTLVTFSNAAAIAVTLPRAGASGLFANGWFVDVLNKGATVVTITPTTSTIGGATTLAVGPGQSVRIVSDATTSTGNYQLSVSNFSGSNPNGSLTSQSLALTAHSGGTQAAALQLTSYFNEVTTVAAAADSVALPLAVVGMQVLVENAAATNSMQVFGAGTDTINNVATATGVAHAAGKMALYYCSKSAPGGNWYRTLSA